VNNVISVRNLSITVPVANKHIPVVDDISFDIPEGKKVGLVGESGSGKSLTALAMMRLIKDPVRIQSGSIFLNNREILGLKMQDFRKVRGSEIAMIYQDPMSALNPIMKVGNQVIESIRLRNDISRKLAKEKTIELFEQVGISEPNKRIESYPFEMSGGMLQRVVIAIALSGDPKVLIADEATTALDVTTQARVLSLIDKLADERGLAVLLITHDLGVAAQYSDDIMVMYAGKIVEKGSVDTIFKSPIHPYTAGLLNSKCDYTTDISKPINSIEGQPPRPDNRPRGCVFSPRCDFASEVCDRDVPKLQFIQNREISCFKSSDLNFKKAVR
jgi:oligopeptide/dipeptide ABC transporter ATP-binding protein